MSSDEKLALATDANGIARALEHVRSRRGLERLEASGLLAETDAIAYAVDHCTHPVTFAMLSPLAPDAKPNQLTSPVEPTSLAALAKSTFNSPFHLGVVEVIRRGYKRQAMEKDRLDKEARVRVQKVM